MSKTIQGYGAPDESTVGEINDVYVDMLIDAEYKLIEIHTTVKHGIPHPIIEYIWRPILPLPGSGGGSTELETYILIDEDGNEIPAVFVADEVVFDATENDIREGMTAATAEGVTTGTKVIPSYHTTEGIKYIPVGDPLSVTLIDQDRYDYTKLQAIICRYNTSLPESVATEKVSIDGSTYAVNSADVIASVIKDHTTKTIDFGIINNGDSPLVLRYFTCKEII